MTRGKYDKVLPFPRFSIHENSEPSTLDNNTPMSPAIAHPLHPRDNKLLRALKLNELTDTIDIIPYLVRKFPNRG